MTAFAAQWLELITKSYGARSNLSIARGKSGRYVRYRSVAIGRRWIKEVSIRCRSITCDTEPRRCTSVKMSAAGYRPHSASSTRSPPRMPVSQSWMRAVRMRGLYRPGDLLIELTRACDRLLP